MKLKKDVLMGVTISLFVILAFFHPLAVCVFLIIPAFLFAVVLTLIADTNLLDPIIDKISTFIRKQDAKFKIGDKVRFKSNTHTDTIIEIIISYNDIIYYRLKNYDYNVSETDLELDKINWRKRLE